VAERTQELVASQERLRALATELNLAEQRERKRLASELHDHLQQMLVYAKLKIGQGKRVADPIPSCAEALNQVDNVLSEALKYTRTLVAERSPPVLREYGLRLASNGWPNI
jgi:signal transduction histidine kinase